MALSPTSSRGGGGGIPQGGPLTADLDFGGFDVEDVGAIEALSGLTIYGDDPATQFDAARVILGHGPATHGGGLAQLRGGDGTTGSSGGGAITAHGGDGQATGIDGGSATLQAGDAGGPSFGSGAKFYADSGKSDGTNGKAIVYTNGSVGNLGEALVSDGNANAVWNDLGQIKIDTHAAKDSADIGAGELYLWFDQTNAAAKLMVKAKSADGTVVTAAIALA
jgi:hypothetical protein